MMHALRTFHSHARRVIRSVPTLLLADVIIGGCAGLLLAGVFMLVMDVLHG